MFELSREQLGRFSKKTDVMRPAVKQRVLLHFSNSDLNRKKSLVKFSEKISGRFVENQQ